MSVDFSSVQIHIRYHIHKRIVVALRVTRFSSENIAFDSQFIRIHSCLFSPPNLSMLFS
jgi:hypothetical protein